MNQFERIEQNTLKLHNLIQIDLVKAYYGIPEPTNEQTWEWIQKFSKRFRKIMDEHLDFLGLYASDREKVLEEVGNLLYEEKEVEKT